MSNFPEMLIDSRVLGFVGAGVSMLTSGPAWFRPRKSHYSHCRHTQYHTQGLSVFSLGCLSLTWTSLLRRVFPGLKDASIPYAFRCFFTRSEIPDTKGIVTRVLTERPLWEFGLCCSWPFFLVVFKKAQSGYPQFLSEDLI